MAEERESTVGGARSGAEPGRGPGEEPEQGAERRASPRRSWLVTSAKAAATLAVTWFILDRVGVTWAEVQELDPAEWSPAWGILALSALLLLAGLSLHALFWGRITTELAGRPIPGFVAIRIHFTANLFRYVPGKVWQLAGLALLAQRRGIPVRPALGGAVVSQVAALVGAGLVGAWVLVARPGVPGALGIAAVGALVAGAAAASVPAVQRWGLRQAFRLARRDPPEGGLPDGTFGARWIALHAAIWALIAAAFWLMAWSFGVEAPFRQLGPAYAAAYVLGYLALFAPAGLGVREGVLVAFLAPVTGAGAAVALSVIARLWSTLTELAPAAVLAALEMRGRTAPSRDPRP